MKLAWISLVVVTVAMSCQSERDFGSPNDVTGGGAGETATGDGDGDGDAGGATGDGDGDGDGDNQPEPECVRASDCPPADGCNEAATCDDGECVPGASECGEFDSDHCACVELDGDCTVQGADADEDGFKSALCEAGPGDDCNDAQATVYPDAEEVCDGLDNDCNGLIDLDDGLEPFVRRVDLPETETPGGITALAWSPSVKAYGAAWTRVSIGAGLRSHNVDWGWIGLDGTFKESISSVIRSGFDSSIQLLEAAIGEMEIAIAAVEDGTEMQAVVHVRRIARNGTSTIGQVISLPTSFDWVDELRLVSTGPDDWLVTYVGYEDSERATYATRIHKGTVVVENAGTLLSDSVETFSKTPGVLVPWHKTVTDEEPFKWSAFGAASLDPIAQGSFGSISQYDFGFSAPGERLAFVNYDYKTERATFSSVNAQKWECQSVVLPFLGGAKPIAPVSQSNGSWSLVSRQYGTYGSSELYFSQVYPDCSSSFGVAKQRFDLAGVTSSVSRESMRAVGNGKGLAVTWYEVSSNTTPHVSLFGPNICDDPDQ